MDLNMGKKSDIRNSEMLLTKNYEKIKLKISENTYEISRVKEEFERFKQLVLEELREERESLRQALNNVAEEFETARKKIYEQVYKQVYAEFQQKHKPFKCSSIQSRKVSAEIKLEEVLKLGKDKFQTDGMPESLVNIETFGNLETFGNIDQAFLPQFREQAST